MDHRERKMQEKWENTQNGLLHPKCTLKRLCNICQEIHLTILHDVSATKLTTVMLISSPSELLYIYKPHRSYIVMLKVVNVCIHNGEQTLKMYAVPDDGAYGSILLLQAVQCWGELLRNVERLWQIDTLLYMNEKTVTRSKTDKIALDLLYSTTARVDIDGVMCYTAPLLRAPNIPVLKDPKLSDKYQEELDNLVQSGYIQRIPSEQIDQQRKPGISQITLLNTTTNTELYLTAPLTTWDKV